MTEIAERLNAAVRKLKNDEIIKTNNDIAIDLGYSQGTISQYLSGKKEVSRIFIEQFESKYKFEIGKDSLKKEKIVEHIPQKAENNSVDTTQESILNLSKSSVTIAESNIIVARSNEALVENNRELLGMLKGVYNKPNSSIPEMDVSYLMYQDRLAMAKMGVPALWPTVDEGLLQIDKFVRASTEDNILEGTG